MLALGEVQPKFGADNSELQALYANGIVSYGREFEEVRTTLGRLVEQTRISERTPIMSVRYTRMVAEFVFVFERISRQALRVVNRWID